MAKAIILFFMDIGVVLSLSVMPECCLFIGYRHASYARVVNERAGLTQERHYQGTCGCSFLRLTLRDAATSGAGKPRSFQAQRVSRDTFSPRCLLSGERYAINVSG